MVGLSQPWLRGQVVFFSPVAVRDTKAEAGLAEGLAPAGRHSLQGGTPCRALPVLSQSFEGTLWYLSLDEELSPLPCPLTQPASQHSSFLFKTRFTQKLVSGSADVTVAWVRGRHCCCPEGEPLGCVVGTLWEWRLGNVGGTWNFVVAEPSTQQWPPVAPSRESPGGRVCRAFYHRFDSQWSRTSQSS